MKYLIFNDFIYYLYMTLLEMLHKYKYDGDTEKYVLIQRRMPLLLTPAEMTWI